MKPLSRAHKGGLVLHFWSNLEVNLAGMKDGTEEGAKMLHSTSQ